MEVVTRISEARGLIGKARRKGERTGFVPTMGALHKGHVSLIEAAVKQSGFVVVSIFVNPTQFGPGEDFGKYPRRLDADAELCEKAGAELIFAPAVSEMYPEENLTWVDVKKLTEPLCGRFRPGHFRGVTTVCTKLFNIVQPDVVFFGQKDAQQAIVIKRMAADLNMPFEIVICPTVREESGLAASSRNVYLSEAEKKDAAILYAALQKCEKIVKAGTTESKSLIAEMRKMIESVPSAKIEYISIVDAETLQDIPNVRGKALVALAVHIGATPLIDNILLDLR